MVIYNNLLQTDIIDKDDFYEMVVNVPGYEKNELEVSFDTNILEVGIKPRNNEELNNESKKYIINEINAHEYSRRFKFNDVNKDNIEVSLVNGQLFIKLNKKIRKSIEIK